MSDIRSAHLDRLDHLHEHIDDPPWRPLFALLRTRAATAMRARSPRPGSCSSLAAASRPAPISVAAKGNP